MSRKEPLLPPPFKKRPSDHITQIREYRLITPLFGGGVEPSKADPVTVIRVTEVRGHLRFWWRACRGGHFSTLAEMKKKEDKIWGAAAMETGGGPSKVQVVVEITKRGQPFKALNTRREEVPIGKPGSPYSYVAFPLNESGGSVQAGIEFNLKISFPSQYQLEVEAALWAWETFGGIGARTRRGFGALRLVKIDNVPTALPTVAELTNKLTKGLEMYVLPGTAPQRVPQLPRIPTATQLCLLLKPREAVDRVWNTLFNALREFRHQCPTTQDERGRRRPGRNKWPEPDAIRRITKRSKYSDYISKIDAFPRAAFGLPIIFEFKKDDQRSGDPSGKNTLQGKSEDGQPYERWASPLILKPIECSDGAVGVALVLMNTSLPPTIILKTGNKEIAVRAELSVAEAHTIQRSGGNQPLLGNQTNVVTAFLEFLKER